MEFKIDIQEVLTNEKAMSSYNAFYSRVIDTKSYKLPKRNKKVLKRFYDRIKDLGVEQRTSLVLQNDLSRILRSFEYRKAGTKLINKTIIKASSHHRAWRYPKVSEVHNKEYYSQLKSKKRPCYSKIDDLLESRKGLSTIGLGTESTLAVQKIDSADVIIDKNTSSERQKEAEKHYLYSVGWSVNGAFDDSDQTS